MNLLNLLICRFGNRKRLNRDEEGKNARCEISCDCRMMSARVCVCAVMEAGNDVIMVMNIISRLQKKHSLIC